MKNTDRNATIMPFTRIISSGINRTNRAIRAVRSTRITLATRRTESPPVDAPAESAEKTCTNSMNQVSIIINKTRNKSKRNHISLSAYIFRVYSKNRMVSSAEKNKQNKFSATMNRGSASARTSA